MCFPVNFAKLLEKRFVEHLRTAASDIYNLRRRVGFARSAAFVSAYN